MKDPGNQSLVGIMRHVDTRQDDSNSRTPLVDQREQFARIEAVSQPSRSKEAQNLSSVHNAQMRMAPVAMRTVNSTRSNSVCSNLLGAAAMSAGSMEKHGVRVSTNSHNRLVERLLRKNSRFLNQLTDWLEQPFDKIDEGAISLDDGVQDMLEAVVCDFVVEMCKGGCRTAQMRRSTFANHVPQAPATAIGDQQNCKALDFDNERSAQLALSSNAVTIPDAVHHSENRLGIDVPPILLALHHVPNYNLQPRRAPAEWHKRAMSIKKAVRPDIGASIDGGGTILLTGDFSKSPTRLPDCVNRSTPVGIEGSATIDNEEDF